MTDNDIPPPDADTLYAVLTQVIDPEIGMNIVDLGLVYDIRISAGRVEIDITMTTPACPMGDMIIDEARGVVSAAVSPDTEVQVNLVWDPPWDASMMSEHAREHFGWQ
jgi:metal-sulfur cluster biosynthetic enzyme